MTFEVDRARVEAGMDRRSFLKFCAAMPIAAAVTVSAATMIEIAESLPPPLPEPPVGMLSPHWLELLRGDTVLCGFALRSFSLMNVIEDVIDVTLLGSNQRSYMPTRRTAEFSCETYDPAALTDWWEMDGLRVGMPLRGRAAGRNDPAMMWVRARGALRQHAINIGMNEPITISMDGIIYPDLVMQGPL